MWTPRQEPGPVAHAIGSTGINLPSGVRLRRHDIARVGAAIRAAVARADDGGEVKLDRLCAPLRASAQVFPHRT
jgi:hypothetical protein